MLEFRVRVKVNVKVRVKDFKVRGTVHSIENFKNRHLGIGCYVIHKRTKNPTNEDNIN